MVRFDVLLRDGALSCLPASDCTPGTSTLSSPSTPPAAQKPRLTRLDLHGFKSFAQKTGFVFEPGITAVVGPNGSGKSNISDAIRWVLGETSYSALRSRKTEDVIFAGGKGKAPAGLTEVTVTFDNEDGWLPSEFTEVTVTRRAYRGGENQYFINGRRVRLKDVAFLTASLGQSYTVVGQGLVDAALSQRAEERRGLFEHAADLTGLRLKVQEAERNLAEADGNIARLTDILTELEPRLRTMERQARQAREWQGLRDRLTFLQRGHYHRLLAVATARHREAERLVSGDSETLDAARTWLEALMTERADAAGAIAAARETLGRHEAQLAALDVEIRRREHERDLLQERQGALARRRDDMADTRSGLDEQVSRADAELAAIATAIAALDGEIAAARAAVDALLAAARARRQERSTLETAVGKLARAVSEHERTLADLDRQRAVLAQRMESASGEQERFAADIASRTERIAELEREMEAFAAEDARIGEQIAAQEAAIVAIRQEIEAERARGQEASAQIAAIEREHGQATNRLEVLQRVHESGTSLHAGPRQVMQWHRDGSLSGIRGTVAELIAVEATYDTAIEVALGGHVQDIVVDRWRDAEAAIELLKRSRAGRATFQPLETLARKDNPRPAPRELERATGVHGIASDLVTPTDADLGPVVRSLLGRMVVVEDLPATRRVLDLLPNGWSAVTLAGEIARAGGSVTGGSQVRESGVLGRERELRELPKQIAGLERKRLAALATREEQAVVIQKHQDRALAADAERVSLLAQRRERTSQRDRLQNWLRDLRNEQVAADRRQATMRDARADQERAGIDLAAQAGTILQTLDEARTAHAEALEALAAHDRGESGDDSALTEAQQALAALDERHRAERRREATVRAQQQALAEEMALRTQRAVDLEREAEALAEQATRLDAHLDRLRVARAGAAGEHAPLADAVRDLEAARAELEGQIETARGDLMARERDLGQRQLVLERARSELATISQRIEDDLEGETPESLLASAPETTLPDGTTLSEDHAEVEREIGRLRDRLRRVGYVGEDIVAEYEREAANQAFLREQLADVEAAAAKLRALLAELHETMTARFEETFARVSQEFSKAFTTLFGGGTAKLVLTTDDENGAPGGIDIVAQPPGKRLQGLALLSGGERSLTAVALLFAILRVNPSPFLLLDEVDAALDEANVVRFRDELRTLASQTQALVITHNRGTVEIADTLYGITMGNDGVSQMLSLRLADLPLDEDVDVRDLASMQAGVPVR
ncbi:MAG: chromosome segregation protein SMC [Thermomicrobiales bacterium]